MSVRFGFLDTRSLLNRSSSQVGELLLEDDKALYERFNIFRA